jgi:hypothetical protein
MLAVSIHFLLREKEEFSLNSNLSFGKLFQSTSSSERRKNKDLLGDYRQTMNVSIHFLLREKEE